MDLGRIHAGDRNKPFCMTTFALKNSEQIKCRIINSWTSEPPDLVRVMVEQRIAIYLQQEYPPARWTPCLSKNTQWNQSTGNLKILHKRCQTKMHYSPVYFNVLCANAINLRNFFLSFRGVERREIFKRRS